MSVSHADLTARLRDFGEFADDIVGSEVCAEAAAVWEEETSRRAALLDEITAERDECLDLATRIRRGRDEARAERDKLRAQIANLNEVTWPTLAAELEEARAERDQWRAKLRLEERATARLTKAAADSDEWKRLLFVAKDWGTTLEAALAEARAETARLAAALRPYVQNCRECSGAGHVYVGAVEPLAACSACAAAREALAGFDAAPQTEVDKPPATRETDRVNAGMLEPEDAQAPEGKAV